VADLIIHGGPILTMDRALPRVEAVAVAGDRILAVGGRGEIMSLATSGAHTIDLRGATLMPGFVDAHSHFFGRADAAGTDVNGISQFILSLGITTTAELYVDPPLLAQLRSLADQQRLRVRLSAYLAANNACGELLDDWWADHPPTRNAGEMLRIGGVKVYADGGSCHEPASSYEHIGGQGLGDLYFSTGELARLGRRIATAQHQVAIHALGDRAVEATLGALKQVIGGSGNRLRNRIEHSTATRPDLRAMHGEIGAVVVVPGAYPTCFLTGKSGTFKYRTPDQYLEWEWPWHRLIDASPGAHFAWHSDFPVFQPPDPMNALYGFVTRAQIGAGGDVCTPTPTMASGAITVHEALAMMTTGSAYALFRENEVGRLSAGLFADLVVLSADPTAVAPTALKDIKVLMTMVGGAVGHCAPGHDQLCPA
jgi:predicted amidohydrolase YtcJ